MIFLDNYLDSRRAPRIAHRAPRTAHRARAFGLTRLSDGAAVLGRVKAEPRASRAVLASLAALTRPARGGAGRGRRGLGGDGGFDVASL